MNAPRIGAMESFARWVSARPYRIVMATIVAVYFVGPIAAALLVLDALKRGPAAAMVSTAAAVLGVTAIAVLFGASVSDSLGLTAPVLIGGAASGVLLASSRSLSLTFQGTMLGSIIVTAAAFAVLPDINQVGQLLQNQILALFELFGATEELRAQIAQVDAGIYLSVHLVTIIASILSSLMLGFWWFSLTTDGSEFGEHFRALKLGRFTGIVLMVIVILGEVLDFALLRNLAMMGVIGFLFQGLAVMHARARSDGWPRSIIVIVYVTLISPLTYISLTGLSAVGLIDNFFELRARKKTEN